MKMNSPQISVVIPVYKVESYLDRCVDSVLTQNFRNLEVILVDDGSPDSCPAICDRYAEHDARVHVIHKKNGGLSSARNAGIEKAVGEYVTFLDSDDAWMEGQLEPVITFLKENQTDMILFSSQDILSDGSVYQRMDALNGKEGVFNILTYYQQLIDNGNLHESACTKIIRREYLEENHLYFQDKLISEDTEWMFRVLRCIRTVGVCNVPLFVCTFGREGSISNSASLKSVQDLLRIIQSSIGYYKTNADGATKIWELMHCAYLVCIVIGIYGGLSRADRKKVKEEIVGVSWLLKLNSGKKVRFVRACKRVFGLKGSGLILHNYIALNRKFMLNRKKINEKNQNSASGSRTLAK
jgi:glycosyltransferase involved in cell wall biosynthesis